MKCFLLLVSALFSLRACEGELRLLQIVYQNREKAPETTYPKDPYRFFWQNGPAKIAVVGMFQLYRLGQRLRRKYSDFVSPPPDEVDLMYPMERGTPCSSLSECFLSGFYKPDSKPPQDKKPFEKLVDPELRCPRLQLSSSRLYDSDEGRRIIGENMNLYEYWSRNSGMEIRNPTDAQELYQSLQLEKSLNLTIPEWVDRFWPELRRQSDIHFSWLVNNQAMQKMAAGPLLGLMVQRMQRHVDGVEHRKYFVYSGKNSSLAGLLAIFGAFNGVEPPLGSTVVLELHKFGELYYVRVLFFYSSNPNSQSDSPEVIILSECSEYCPFDKFRRLTTRSIPNNWEQQCSMYGTASHPSTSLFILGCVLFLLHLASY